MKFNSKILVILLFSFPNLTISQDLLYKKHSVVLDLLGPSKWFSLSYELNFIKKNVIYDAGFGLGYGGRFSSKIGPNLFYLIPYFNFRLNKKISPFISLCYTPFFDPYAIKNKENYVCPTLNNCPDKMIWSAFSQKIGVVINVKKIFLRPYYCGLIDVKYKSYISWLGLSVSYHL